MDTKVILICTLPIFIIEILGSIINDHDRILSRKKRYLTFPEGSSLQLVYCMTMPVYGYSTIFTIGGTAALAWELPHDPYKPFRKENNGNNNNLALLLNKRIDKPSTYSKYKQEIYAPSPMKYKNMYNQRPNKYASILKPSFSYKTLPLRYNTIKLSPAYQQKINRKVGYSSQNYPTVGKDPYYKDSDVYSEPITTYLHPVYNELHRRTRRELYSKIEKFFKAQSKDGRACLLKSVCEVSQASLGKGTFMQEIMKAIFRVKPHDEYKDEDDYDAAFNKRHNCTEMYPTCQASVWNMF